MSSDSAPPVRWWRRVAPADWRALGWFVAIPVVLFVVPALFGRPAIDGDNFLQNFPLRVLAGQQLRAGHLPLLNPLADAGMPLLGGMNAGALFPATLLFAVLPGVAAWVVGLIGVYVVSATGLYALARWHGVGRWAAFWAALSYTYTGAMVGQLVHLGVVQGFAILPWFTLALVALARRLARHRDESWRGLVRVAWPPVVALAVTWGLTCLTGEPRAIATMELVGLVVVPVSLLVRTSYWIATWRARAVYVGGLVVGLAWGTALSAVQLLPGYAFIHLSQRSDVTYGFFGSGSLAVRWSVLLAVPDIFGGNGSLGQPGYFANYNLPEVTGYAGILALVALAAFVLQVTRRGWRGPERDWTVYLVLVAVGLLATWGYYTPFGHLFRLIPLFGSTRLQSRNVGVVDFALALLLAWWLDRLARGERAAGVTGRRRTVLIAIPSLIALFYVALLAWGPEITHGLGVSSGAMHLARSLTLTDGLFGAVAIAFAVALWRVGTSPRWRSALVAVLVADMVLFSLFSATADVGGNGPREPSPSHARAVLGISSGRFALVDFAGVNTGAFRQLGEPNTNVFTGLASVQGYSSLIASTYDDATDTHPVNWLDACALAEGRFTQLRRAAVAIAWQELMSPVAGGAAATGCVPPVVEPVDHRYFGEPLAVGSLSVRGVGGAAIASGRCG